MSCGKKKLKYRGRGVSKKTGRESYVTTVWRNTRNEVIDDIMMFGYHYKRGSLKIVTKR